MDHEAFLAVLASLVLDAALFAAMQTTALLDLELKSTTGIIDLTAKRFEEYVSGKSRPYTIVVIAGEQLLNRGAHWQLTPHPGISSISLFFIPLIL